MARLRTGFFVSIPLIILIALVLIVFYPFSGNESSEEIIISEVEIGSVIRSIPGEGTIVPQSEVIILSPASSIIKNILKEVGSHVESGEAIVILH